MFNTFSQSKVTYKIFFQTKYKNILIFEELFIYPLIADVIGISYHEITSQTIDSQPEDNWMIEIYLSQEPSINSFKNILFKFSQEHNLELLSNVLVEKIEDNDWVAAYQKNLTPFLIEQFFISSRIFKDACPKDKSGIFIEASRAFGTGEHATTAGCIEAINKLASMDFKNIIDIGTGTGILSFVAEKIWPNANILACDIDEVATEIAKENAVFNNSKVHFYTNSDKIITP